MTTRVSNAIPVRGVHALVSLPLFAMMGLGCHAQVARVPTPSAAFAIFGGEFAVARQGLVCKFSDFDDCRARCNSTKDASSCNNLGADFELGIGAPRDLRTASDYYEIACNAHLLAGCTNLARLRGTPRLEDLSPASRTPMPLAGAASTRRPALEGIDDRALAKRVVLDP